MPEDHYNSTLQGFDVALVEALDEMGLVVLVETFAGKRIYYSYVADDVTSRSSVSEVISACGYADEVTFRGGFDEQWDFYKLYCEGLGSLHQVLTD